MHEASDAIRLVSNPSVSKVLIRIRCVASSCGAIIVANTKELTRAEIEQEEGKKGAPLDQADRYRRGKRPVLPFVTVGTAPVCTVLPCYLSLQQSHSSHRLTPQSLKRLTENPATPNSPFIVERKERRSESRK